jgi:hypothetical protein
MPNATVSKIAKRSIPKMLLTGRNQQSPEYMTSAAKNLNLKALHCDPLGVTAALWLSLHTSVKHQIPDGINSS